MYMCVLWMGLMVVERGVEVSGVCVGVLADG